MSQSRWVPEGLTKTIITTVVSYGAEKLIGMIFEESRRRKEKKTTRDLECKIDKAVQELRGKIEAIEERLKEFQESRQKEHQLLRAELEKKNQGKEEKEISRALLSRLIWKFQQLFEKIEILEEDLEELMQSSQLEFQLLRADQK